MTKVEGKRRFRRRKFVSGEVNHVYQRTRNGFNIFYDLEDYLVYFTIFSVSAKKYGVVVLGLCLMIDHLHMLICAEHRVTLSEFIRQVTSVFVMEYNASSGRKGPLFSHRFGSAPKVGLKKIRTAIAYLYNNPVEKQLCCRVQDYRWNFLCYSNSVKSFPTGVTASRKLQRAMSEVLSSVSLNKHLTYSQLRRMMKGLTVKEYELLADYIIYTYNPIDYEELVDYYGSYDNMLIAINSNTGSEYDVRENYIPHSDTYYDKLSCYVRHNTSVEYLRKVTVLPDSEKLKLCFQMAPLAPKPLIHKYLHLRTCSI